MKTEATKQIDFKAVNFEVGSVELQRRAAMVAAGQLTDKTYYEQVKESCFEALAPSYLEEAQRKRAETLADGRKIEEAWLAGEPEILLHPKPKPKKGRNALKAEEQLGDDRPFLILNHNKLSESVDKTQQMLLDAKIYQRRGKLVYPDVEPMPDEEVPVAQLRAVSSPWLLNEVTKLVNVQTPGITGTKPSKDLIAAILNNSGGWPFPPTTGVVTTPVLRKDLTILDQEGYDRKTGLILMSAPKLPEIKTTRLAAEKAARDVLEPLLEECKLVGPADLAVAMSGLMTPIVRSACRCVPMHAINAPLAGSGKSYVWNIAGAIASGQPEMYSIVSSGDQREFEKKLDSTVIAGVTQFCIDNQEGELRGATLCRVILSHNYIPRTLGKNEQPVLRNTWTTYCNGNNLQIVADLTRRTIIANIDTGMERPELRQFKHDEVGPIEWVLADRGKYIAAVMTIALAYHAADRPKRVKGIDRNFLEWSDLVRSPLMWLGYADPYLTVEIARTNDPELDVQRQVFLVMEETFGTGPEAGKTLADMVRVAQGGPLLDRPVNPSRLREALALTGKKLEAGDLGYWFRKNSGKVVSGLRLESLQDRLGVAQWYVRKIGN